MPVKDKPGKRLAPDIKSPAVPRAGPQATFVLNSMPRVNPEEQGRLRAQLGYFPEDLVAFGGQKGGDFSKQSFGVPSFSFLIQSRLVACTCPKDSKNAIK